MAEANESSPLLATENNHDEATGSGDDITSFPEVGSYTAARDYFPRAIKVITSGSLIVSIMSFIILLTTALQIDFIFFEPTPLRFPCLVKGSMMIVS